jgi:proline racemase
VRIHNVPCRAGVEAVKVAVPGIGPVTADMAFGGIWYAVVDAAAAGLTLSASTVSAALQAGSQIRAALGEVLAPLPSRQGGGTHPSVLFYAAESRLRARHLLVLAPNKFDRSPCGTGTSARLALMAHRGEIADGETYVADNLFGAAFKARVVARLSADEGEAIVPEIEGAAHITAFSTIVKEKTDPLSAGFLCQ